MCYNQVNIIVVDKPLLLDTIAEVFGGDWELIQTVIRLTLIKIIRDFLAARLYGKICLAMRDDLFTRVAVLYDEITCIAGKLKIIDVHTCSAPYLDHFVDLNKMVVNIETAIPAGKPCLINNSCKIMPFGIVQRIGKFTGKPILRLTGLRSRLNKRHIIFEGIIQSMFNKSLLTDIFW